MYLFPVERFKMATERFEKEGRATERGVDPIVEPDMKQYLVTARLHSQ